MKDRPEKGQREGDFRIPKKGKAGRKDEGQGGEDEGQGGEDEGQGAEEGEEDKGMTEGGEVEGMIEGGGEDEGQGKEDEGQGGDDEGQGGDDEGQGGDDEGQGAGQGGDDAGQGGDDARQDSLDLDIDDDEIVDLERYEDKDEDEDEDERELGKALLKIRGENPYSFPFRIYPHLFEKSRTFAITQTSRYEEEQDSSTPIPYPAVAFDGSEITAETRLKYTCLYADPLSDYQRQVYEDMVQTMLESQKRQVFSWGSRVQSLNIVFPGNQTGDEGFTSVMKVAGENYSYKGESLVGQVQCQNRQHSFLYRKRVRDFFGLFPIFVFGDYQYGLGFGRSGIFAVWSRQFIATNFVPRKTRGKYMLITGESKLTPEMMKVGTSETNKDGDLIPVVLISEAGSEGIDFMMVRKHFQ